MIVKPIRGIRDLEWRLNVQRKRLRRLANQPHASYRCYQKQVGGKTRLIEAPFGEMKRVQRLIDRRVLKQVAFPDCVHGAVKGRSPKGNALVHVGSTCLISIDVKAFFPSISDRQIFHVWSSILGCGTKVSGLLTRLTTLNHHLPQGAPTSPSLANLVLSEFDREVEVIASEMGFCYSRWVDDLSFSSSDGEGQNELIEVVVGKLSLLGFQASRRKLSVSRRNRCQVVTGYTVNSDHPSVPRLVRDRVRARVKHLDHLPSESARAEALRRSIAGSVSHIEQTNPGVALKLRTQLKSGAKSNSRNPYYCDQ